MCLALALVVAQIVSAAPPSATIDVSDVNPEVGEPIEFSATVTDEDVGDTHSFEWNFGDGTTSRRTRSL